MIKRAHLAGALLALLFAGAAIAQNPGNIQISVTQPLAGALVGDQVEVVATIQGNNEITGANASIGVISQALSFSASAWRGALDISSLARNSYQLVVAGTDGLGNSNSISITVVHDLPPGIVVVAPKSLAVATPQLPISVSCNDDDPAGCASLVASIDNTPLMNGTASLNGNLDLSAYDGQAKTLVLTATDSAGQPNAVSIPIFVDGSPALRKVAEVPGRVLDVDAGRILYYNNGLYIRSRADGSDTSIPTGTDRAFLTDAGAVFVMPEIFPVGCGFHLTTYPYFQLRSWERGTLVDVGCLGQEFVGLLRFDVKGRYAASPRLGLFGSGAQRRDVVTGTNVLIDGTGKALDVAANGAVVFTGSAGTSLYGPDGARVIWSAAAIGARTDGSAVAYTPPYANEQQLVSLVLNRNGAETQLIANSDRNSTPYFQQFGGSGDWSLPVTGYQVANGTVAFLKTGPTGVTQVWRVAPDDQLQQLTFGSAASRLDRLGDEGTLVFTTGNRRFLVGPQSTTPADVASALGNVLFPGVTPYLAIGNSVFVIGSADVDVSPLLLGLHAGWMAASSPAQQVAVVNLGVGPVPFTISTSNPQFSQTNNCGSVAEGASCTIEVVFSPATSEGPIAATMTISGAASPQVVHLVGEAELSLVTHYYYAILNRSPDAAGKAFWEGEAQRLAGLGANSVESVFVMAGYFFNSPEYLAAGKSNSEFVTDLYNTFFNRAPDAGGLNFWSSEIANGLPREVVLFSFMFSPEFRSFAEAIFGNTQARPEVDMVMDFFRGILNRLPETEAFNYWVGQLRAAQCQGAGAVYSKVNEMSYGFIFGPEYANRGRTNTQFVTDMYYSFLRRGGDNAGVQFWINQLNGGTKDRNTIRSDFIGTPEFGARVDAVVNAGCI